MGASPQWRAREYDVGVRETLEARGCLPLVARVLAARGVTVECLDEFTHPSLARLVPPESLPGMSEAVDVVLSVVRARRRIVVFGDYDADGVCATAILVKVLECLGAPVSAFIPLREEEGYGMTQASLNRLLAEHPDVALVVTVDNGISSPVEVAALRARGVKVVVTDHHLPGSDLPEADALVNPRVASAADCADLCGAGVAFFLAWALKKSAPRAGVALQAGADKISGPLLVLAGLATVTDLVPLKGQNRVLVAQALANFRACAPLGLRALLERSQRRAESVAVRDFGFALGPRINAAGRMRTAKVAYDLLMATDREEARRLAVKVDELNAERKTKEREMADEARAQIGDAPDSSAVVVRGEDWSMGVAGIVASRLLESAHVPVAVAVGDTGSVRAPDGYNVHEALSAASEHLLRFGGHAAAGGFTVRPGAFEAFRAAFCRACAAQRAAAPEAACLPFDGWTTPDALTVALHGALQRLEPYGEGHPQPVFGLRDVAFAQIGVMGAEGRHLSLTFTDRSIPRAVWWGHGPQAEALRGGAYRRFDVLFTLSCSDFGGEPLHVELCLVDVRPAE